MKRQKSEHDQLPIDELLPEAPTIAHQPVKKVLNKQPLYRVKKSRG
jgi:hypothetical protein